MKGEVVSAAFFTIPKAFDNSTSDQLLNSINLDLQHTAIKALQMASAKAQDAISARCQKCKVAHKRCSRTRPCERCCCQGIGYEGCIPAVDRRSPATRADRSTPMTNEESEDELEQIKPQSATVRGFPTLMTDENGTARILMTPFSDRATEQDRSTETKASIISKQHQRRYLLLDVMQVEPALPHPEPPEPPTLREALSLALEQGFSVEELRAEREEVPDDGGAQCICPAQLTRHHLQQGQYFIHGASWFEKYGVCKECEGGTENHYWWCSQSENQLGD